MARRPPPKLSLGTLQHFAAAAVGLTICLALFVGDKAAEVEDAHLAMNKVSHQTAKAVVTGNERVAQKGGGIIIGMTTRSVPSHGGSWGSAAGTGGGGPAPASGGSNAPPPTLAQSTSGLPEWEGGPNVLPPDHPANLTRSPEQSQAAGAPRNRKKGSGGAPTAQQLNAIIEASRLRAARGGAGA